MRHLLFTACALICALMGIVPAKADWDEAIRTNQTDIIRALYRERAHVDEATDRGKTALMAAAAAGDAELVGELLARGADPAATNRLGGSVLMYAIGSRDGDTIRLLLDTGVPVDVQASNGWSAMMMAAARNDATTIALLGQRGADPNSQDIYGWTPLMRAVYERNESAAEALLALPGIEPGRTNRNAQNALHLAVIGGSAELVGALLERRVEQIADQSGHTPQGIARELRRDDLMALLKLAQPQAGP